MRLRLRNQKENLIYLLLWLVLFLAPAISMFIRSNADGELSDFNWEELFHLWRIYAIYFAIFLIHNFVLAPLLVYKNRNGLYLATTTCLVAVVMLYNCMSKPEMKNNAPPHHPAKEGTIGPARHQTKGPDLSACRPPAEEFRDRGPREEVRQPDRGPRPDMPPRGKEAKDETPPPPNPNIFFGPGDVVNTVFLILLLGMNIGVKFFFKSDRDKQELQELQRKSLEQQLEYLKYQINPHFFMNTLNNIHALVDIDPEQAKTTIVDLSRLMRYVLYEGSNSLVPLGRDIEFLKNYIKLMRLRYSDRVNISIDIPNTVPDCQIPPMLLITFVENAFKHGVSYQQGSFINIAIRFAGQRLCFSCKNSKPDTTADTTPRERGVGLANVQQRLNLLFANDYQLDINDGDDSYSVSLDMPLSTQKTTTRI